LIAAGTEIAVDLRTQQIRYIISGLPVLAATLLLSSASFAASPSIVPCDQVSRDLKSLEVPATALTVDRVDHAHADPVAANPDSIDERTSVTDSVAPILYLTPRVTNIVRDVFGTTSEELPEQTALQRSTSPGAPMADADQKAEKTESSDVENETSDLPRFQQQMYRKDI
jgi:hypothetical protein